MAKDLFNIIEYRNDAFGKGTIKKAVVYEVDRKYPFFLKVADYPINKNNLNKRMIWAPTAKETYKSQLGKSGDWCIIGEILINTKLFK